ncbi:uncharacterized protein LOC119991193 isoform X2 [Tripterygium wilfordii]|uniref:uncharacterized protein LOC119991193 isoform X2 n=1 Tax=Tripterygium wilfordii TaxID=458696 RepID=UPI0018F83F6B|nr:uncharacterized protein LOC119991193 isoform X2 [Tripterygium wilfordii]
METEKWHSKLFLLVFLSLLLATLSNQLNITSRGCYWTESCQHQYHGDCKRTNHWIFSQSKDCNGLCTEPLYLPCTNYYTRFYCCIPDCSDPHLVYEDTKWGYCQSGAELLVQRKPQETFKWVAGPWKPCSYACEGGVRQRDVDCFAVFEETLIPDYPVYDHKCSREEKPSSEEPCNSISCLEIGNGGLQGGKHGTMPGWTITLVILLGIVAVGGIGFVGYIKLKRDSSSRYGSVYIMMEGYA